MLQLYKLIPVNKFNVNSAPPHNLSVKNYQQSIPIASNTKRKFLPVTSNMPEINNNLNHVNNYSNLSSLSHTKIFTFPPEIPELHIILFHSLLAYMHMTKTQLKFVNISFSFLMNGCYPHLLLCYFHY